MTTPPRPPATGRPVRILLTGGSVSFGLGVRGHSFGKRLNLGAAGPPEVLALTGPGWMVDRVLRDHRQEIEDFAPDLAVICAGMSEQMVHPPAAFQRLLERHAPPTWHGVAGLQPRAYFSTHRLRRLRQRLLSWLKVRIKRTVLKFGHHQRMGLEDFEKNLVSLLERLDALGCPVVLVGSAQVDDWFFPGTEKAYRALSARLVAVAAAHDHVRFLDPRAFLDCWEDYVDDNFHWNDVGHDKAARATESLLARWDVLDTTSGSR